MSYALPLLLHLEIQIAHVFCTYVKNMYIVKAVTLKTDQTVEKFNCTSFGNFSENLSNLCISYFVITSPWHMPAYMYSKIIHCEFSCHIYMYHLEHFDQIVNINIPTSTKRSNGFISAYPYCHLINFN